MNKPQQWLLWYWSEWKLKKLWCMIGDQWSRRLSLCDGERTEDWWRMWKLPITILLHPPPSHHGNLMSTSEAQRRSGHSGIDGIKGWPEILFTMIIHVWSWIMIMMYLSLNIWSSSLPQSWCIAARSLWHITFTSTLKQTPALGTPVPDSLSHSKIYPIPNCFCFFTNLTWLQK